MKHRLLAALAWLLARPRIADALIRRAMRTPYFHLPGYMERWWLFNGYPQGQNTPTDAVRKERRRWPWLPSIRIHHILREDYAQHMHDHPWNARTFILRGWYLEHRADGYRYRKTGDTADLRFGEYHNIKQVSPGGVWTLFVIGSYGGQWGFDVDGQKMLPRDYAAQYPERAL